MKRSILIGSMLVLVASCLAADWPRWRGPDGTGHVPAGVTVPQTLPAEPKALWRERVGHGLASPVVSGGRLFHLDNQQGKEVVHAVDAASGKELWSAPLDDTFRDGHSPPGPRCTPLVDGERVYVQSCRGEFRCLRVADGKEIWRVNFVKDFGAVFIGERGSAAGADRHGNSGSAVIDGDRVIVAAGGRKGASVVCLDKRSGKVIWKSQNDVQGHGGAVVATILGVKQVVSFTAEAVIGLDVRDGKLLWRAPVKTRLGRHVITPVVVDDTVVVSSYLAGLIGVRIAKEGEAFRAERAWLSKALAVNFMNPVAVGSHVYGLGPGKSLFCVDVRTGKKAWVEKGFFSGMVGRGYASFVVMKDRILVLAERGQLLLVAADPKRCRVIGRTRVCGQNWCHPAYVDGKLFLRDERELRCVGLMP